jgi:hypothetical protein
MEKSDSEYREVHEWKDVQIPLLSLDKEKHIKTVYLVLNHVIRKKSYY